MFGGNLIKQPAYSGRNFVVHNKLKNADIVMNRSFWIEFIQGYLMKCMIMYSKFLMILN